MNHLPTSSKTFPTRQFGFSLIEVMAVVTIITILTAILLPAVQQAREAARRCFCKNNLHQLGYALTMYHEVHNSFPMGYHSDHQWTWGTAILPYLEQTSLYESLEINQPLQFDARKKELLTTKLPVYYCPSSPFQEHPGWIKRTILIGDEEFELALASYAGVMGTLDVDFHPLKEGNGIFWPNSHIADKDITDGLSQTLMLGERSMVLGSSAGLYVTSRGIQDRFHVLGLTTTILDDHNYSLNCEPTADSNYSNGFSSEHRSGAQFVLADTAVRFISEDIEPDLYELIGNRKDGINTSMF